MGESLNRKNFKHKITNNIQIPISNAPNVSKLIHCNLRFVWDLSFVIWNLENYFLETEER
jgi:hypothetical protein